MDIPLASWGLGAPCLGHRAERPDESPPWENCPTAVGWSGGRSGGPLVSASAGREPPLHLPIGTVTFLFADRDDAARLWDTDVETITAAMTRSYAPIEDAIGRHGGVRRMARSGSDLAIAAFLRASDALATAWARSERSAPWHGRHLHRRACASPSTPLRLSPVLRAAGTADVVDGHLVFITGLTGGTVLTSDEGDLSMMAAHAPTVVRIDPV